VVRIKGVEKTLELVDRTGLRRIAIGGGEPTLFPGLAEYVRQMKEQGIFVSVLTNGRMLKFKDRLEELVDAGVDHFHVSVHSHVEQVHDAISRTAGSYRDTLNGLHNLRQAQAHTPLDVSIIQVISRLNVALLEDFARFVKDLSLDLDYVLLCYCIIEMESPREQLDLLVSYRDLMPHIHAAHEVLRSTGQRVYVDNVPPCLLRGNELLCLDFHKFNHLTVTGVTAISGTETQKYRFLQQSIKSYQRSYAPQCVSCVIKPYCGGVYRSYIDAFGVSEIDPYRFHEITTRLSQVSNTHAP